MKPVFLFPVDRIVIKTEKPYTSFKRIAIRLKLKRAVVKAAQFIVLGSVDKVLPSRDSARIVNYD